MKKKEGLYNTVCIVKPSQIIILWYKYESCSWICSLGSTQSDDIMSNDNISRLSEHWPF